MASSGTAAAGGVSLHVVGQAIGGGEAGVEQIDRDGGEGAAIGEAQREVQQGGARKWKDIWSAGQGVALAREVKSSLDEAIALRERILVLAESDDPEDVREKERLLWDAEDAMQRSLPASHICVIHRWQIVENDRAGMQKLHCTGGGHRFARARTRDQAGASS